MHSKQGAKKEKPKGNKEKEKTRFDVNVSRQWA